MRIDFAQIPTPCYVCEEAALERNLTVLERVQREAGCRIIVALKGYALWATFPRLRRVLHGAAASSLHEARLGHEEMGGELHVCAPAYRDDEFDAILSYATHIVFNSFSQWARFRNRVRDAQRAVACGIRVNPRHSEAATPLYDPCAPSSRLGVTLPEFKESELDGISGLHVHALCENEADAFERMLAAFEAQFGKYLDRMAWVNFGGGQLITRQGYEIDRLVRLIRTFRARYGLDVILEPGEAVGWNVGPLVASVLDIVRNEREIAILDSSAATHMPDCLEMPYRPDITGADRAGVLPHTYRLAGCSCLAGDVIGDYSFPEPLRPGAKLAFENMIHYTMVKSTTFNGLNLPAIALWTTGNRLRILRRFGYEDYKGRLS